MPHSKTGRKVELGDRIVSVQKYAGFPDTASAGIVVSISESETCNATIIPLGTPSVFVTLNQCVHVEDLKDFAPEPVAE